jgi:pilus assembly protein CpaC
VPILGNLFRSTNYRKGETELVIIVTPYRVNPVNGNEIKLPTDGFNAPNEAARLFGMQESAPGLNAEPQPSAVQGTVPTGPAISQAQPAAIAPAQAGASGKKRRKDRRASNDAPTPGFSFN